MKEKNKEQIISNRSINQKNKNNVFPKLNQILLKTKDFNVFLILLNQIPGQSILP